MAGAAIGALEPDGFNWSAFSDQTDWDAMKSSYISGLTGRAAGSALELGSFGFTGDTYGDTAAFTGLAGGLSESAVEYGLTGSTKLNVLGIRGTGILELNLGERETLFELGMGGADISGGTLIAAGAGCLRLRQEHRDKPGPDRPGPEGCHANPLFCRR